MAKWDIEKAFKDQGPRNGEIRAVNYIDGMDDQGNWVFRHTLQQFWDGRWSDIKVYHRGDDGSLQEVAQ